MNSLAKYINDRLGVKIYDEEHPSRYLQLVQYSKKQIKALHIDDLVFRDTQYKRTIGTYRLVKITKELIAEKNVNESKK